MVALTTCAACMTGDHEKHSYWIQKPPEGVMGGFACGCSGPDQCAGNGEKILRSLFGDAALRPPAAGRGDTDSSGEAWRYPCYCGDTPRCDDDTACDRAARPAADRAQPTEELREAIEPGLSAESNARRLKWFSDAELAAELNRRRALDGDL